MRWSTNRRRAGRGATGHSSPRSRARGERGRGRKEVPGDRRVP